MKNKNTSWGEIMKSVVKFVAYLFSLIFSEKVLKINYFFSWNFMWYIKKRNFKHVGKNSFVGLKSVIKGSENIIIGDNFYAEDNFRIETYSKYLNYKYNPEIIIKDNVSFGYRCHIGCINRIVINDNCLFGSNVYITDHFHGKIEAIEFDIPPRERKLYSKGQIIIGRNCWIGDNVTIMPNVKIGDNAIIGANSVITHDIDKNTVVAGIPAKIIKVLM